MIVVRSVEQCAEVLYRLLTGTLETELWTCERNTMLKEEISGSVLRVVSRHRLLAHAFWNQYFEG